MKRPATPRTLNVAFSVWVAATGLWCDRCSLPSTVAFDVHVLTNRGVGGPVKCTQCTQCTRPSRDRIVQ